MATKGTDGTDVGTTITTQGDILYRDGSGLQRLAAGTAGHVLQTGGSGANPSWTAVSSDFVKLGSHTFSTAASYVDFQSCFSSTYKHYELRYTDLVTSDSSVYPEVGYLKASDNSHDTSISYYSKAYQITNQLSAASDGGVWSQSDSQGFRPINTWNFNGGTSTPHLGRMTFTNPNTSVYKYCTFESQFIQNAVANNGTVGMNWGMGGAISTTAYSGLRFATNSGNYHGGTVSIYGIKG
tara:strand:- start:138 stop:854 length:717 start_codon:yes stop_codon:yes gene_type:complete